MFLAVFVVVVVCGRAPLGHSLPFPFQPHQIPHRSPLVSLPFPSGFYQIWWILLVLMVVVVFACFDGFGGLWWGPPGAPPTISFDFHQI